MAPTNPWTTAKKQPSSEPSFPGLTPAVSSEAKTQYDEIQEDELLALASIYGEDFQRIETKSGAWKKAEPSFSIRIKSQDEELALTLHVTFVATYPKSPPLLFLKDNDDLREVTKFKLQKVIETKPKELIIREEAMIMDIVDLLRDILEDAAAAKAAGRELPSLEEERTSHEMEQARLAQKQEEEEERKRQDEKREEDRMLGAMIEEELSRQRAKNSEVKKKTKATSKSKDVYLDDEFEEQRERILFDQPMTLVDEHNNPRPFQAVAVMVKIRSGPVADCFTVRPILKGSHPQLLVLKRSCLPSDRNDNANFKAQLRALENELEEAKKCKHQSILELYDFKVQKMVTESSSSENLWTVSVLMEYGNKGSLEEVLDIAGDLGVEKVRAWTIELLDALRYLHDRGILHKDLQTSNILLVRSATGSITAKLADSGFQRALHEINHVAAVDTLAVAKSIYWLPPENANATNPVYTQKTDVWDLGVIFLQMIFGLGVLQKYASPDRVTDALDLSESLYEIIHKFFKPEPKKRPRAFELSSSEFLATDAPIMADNASAYISRLGSSTALLPVTLGRQRHDSMNAILPNSRFRADFIEEGRLGKGGFGEVVKVRKKLDGQFYAIKKITQKPTASLTEVLNEVRLLSQLNNNHVVRYFNTWTEEVPEVSDTDDTESSTLDESISIAISGPNVEFGVSTGGLDFISSSGYPAIEFGYESDDNAILDEENESETEEEEGDGTSSQSKDEKAAIRPPDGHRLGLRRTRSDSRQQRSTKTILYIQMEYCERRTMRDLIKRGLYKDNEEIWRLLRQTLDGLTHIHGLNIVHRDLKPENIFIDGALNVKIGDFGLATAGQYSSSDKTNIGYGSHNMTTSIGTPYYTAPEVRSSIGTYNSKVDMYSLGIILFEMCYHPIVGMERSEVLQGLRRKEPRLPSDFKVKEKTVQADIILSLLDHNPRTRPSSSELIRSGKLPVQMESETIRQTLEGMSDPKSPYYQKMMATLFSRPPNQAKDYAWDMDGSLNHIADDLMLQSLVKQKLASIFRRHGALEAPRTFLFPRCSYYPANAVQLLDPSGTLVQLPYDLTLPHARNIAKHTPTLSRSFTFGTVFRDKGGGQPKSSGEVDFDIVSDSLDLALKDAEVIKVMDEIIVCFPSLAASQMCFHINHSELLNIIFDFCRINLDLRSAVAEILSKLNIGTWTWQKIRNELRSPLIGVAATSLDDLQRFDFRDTPARAFQKMKTIFGGADIFERASPAIAHLNEVIAYLKTFNVRSKIFICPLGTYKENFYKGGILFSCLSDTKHRDVLAAGGRYDSLVRQYRPKMGSQSEDRHAVGFSLTSEKLSASMKKFQKTGSKNFLKRPDDDVSGIWTTKRCDILVASFDASILRSTGIELLQHLWAEDMSAELAADARSPEDLHSKYRDEQHQWIVTIKSDLMLKVKSIGRKDAPDVDFPINQLLPWLNAEMRERDQRDGVSDRARLLRHPNQPDTNGSTTHEQEVRVLMAQTKSKKSNRRNVVESAHAQALSLVQSFMDGPILAIETTDHVMELIKETRLSDPDSWRKVSQSVPSAERRYIGEIHDVIKTMASQNKDITRSAFFYNFRSGTCIHYDMGL